MCLVAILSQPLTSYVPSLRYLASFLGSLRYALSLGVNLLGHNGNSQDGRMKVLIWFGPSFVCRVLGSLRFTGHYETNGMRSVATNGKRRVWTVERAGSRMEGDRKLLPIWSLGWLEVGSPGSLLSLVTSSLRLSVVHSHGSLTPSIRAAGGGTK